MKLKNQNYFDGVYHLKNENAEDEEQVQEPKKLEKKKPSRKKKGE